MSVIDAAQMEVFDILIRGNTNKQVARALLYQRTIKAHRHRVMEKMQVQSLVQLVSLAERVGIAARPTWRVLLTRAGSAARSIAAAAPPIR